MKTTVNNSEFEVFEVADETSKFVYVEFDASEDISHEKQVACERAVYKCGYTENTVEFIEFRLVDYPNLFKAVFGFK